MTKGGVSEMIGILKEIEKLCDEDFVFRDMGKFECGEFRRILAKFKEHNDDRSLLESAVSRTATTSNVRIERVLFDGARQTHKEGRALSDSLQP